MMWIERLPDATPCAAVPGKTSDPEGFVDTLNRMPGFDPDIRISVAAVKHMATYVLPKHLQLPSRDEYQRACAERDALKVQFQDLEAENNELARQLDAVETLRNSHWREGKHPGRKIAA